MPLIEGEPELENLPPFLIVVGDLMLTDPSSDDISSTILLSTPIAHSF